MRTINRIHRRMEINRFMKYILSIILFVSIFFLACTSPCSAYAQDYRQKGTTFIQTSNKSDSGNKATKYTWEKGGVKYPIYLSAKGKVYIIRTSKKTGKEYKQYLPDTVAETIKKGK